MRDSEQGEAFVPAIIFLVLYYAMVMVLVVVPATILALCGWGLG